MSSLFINKSILEVQKETPRYRFLQIGADTEVWGGPRSYKHRQDLIITEMDTVGVEEMDTVGEVMVVTMVVMVSPFKKVAMEAGVAV